MPRLLASSACRAVSLLAVVLLAACAASACSSSAERACVGDTSQAIRVCAGPTTVRGLDVSAYQSTVDFAQVKGAGREFVVMRVSAGTNVDGRFAANWPNAKRAGLVRGAYQYFYPSQDVDRQADLVVTQLRAAGYTSDDLPPVLDLETRDGLPAATVVARAKRWLARVEAALDVRPMVYTAAFMSGVTGTNFSSYPLWVANYGVTCPELPSGWSKWLFWQDSSTGRIAGVTGNVDTDFFNGSVIELRAFARASHLGPRDAGAGDGGGRDAGDSGALPASDAATSDAAIPIDAGPRAPPPSAEAGVSEPDPCDPP